MSYTYLVPPVPGTCIADPGELEQLVSQAVPGTNIGFTYRSAVAPDVVTNPEQKDFLWIDTSGAVPVERHWNEATLSWEQDLPEPGSITGDMIADHTIELVKLSPAGGTPDYVLRLNPAGTDVIYDDTQNLFTFVNRLSVGVLSLSPIGDYMLTSDGFTNTWLPIGGGGGTVQLSDISLTGAATGMVIGFNGAITKWDYIQNFAVNNTFPITKIVPGPANNILGTNGAGTSLTWLTPASLFALFTSVRYNTASGGRLALPAAADFEVFAHGLGTVPTRWGGWIQCVTAEGTYSIGDKIPWDSLYDADGDELRYFSAIADATNITLSRPTGTGGAVFTNAKDGSVHNESITPGNWLCGVWADAN